VDSPLRCYCYCSNYTTVLLSAVCSGKRKQDGEKGVCG